MSPPGRKANSDKISPWRAWVSTLWSLAAYLVLVLFITAFVVYYIDGNYFNLHDRRPWTSLTDANGERVRWGSYAPLQSDITTILSALLVVLRWVAVSWTAESQWRSAFMLMGADGLRRQSLEQIVQRGLLFPFPYVGGPLAWLVGSMLFINTVAQSLSPLLTGSITWVPSNAPARHLPYAAIPIPVASNTGAWDWYQNGLSARQKVTVGAAGLVTSAWQPSDGKGALKRTLRSATGMGVNSTIASNVGGYWHNMGLWKEKSLTVTGTVALVPDPNTTWENGSFPSPAIRSETRMMVIYATQFIDTPYPTCRLDDSNTPSSLPPGLGLVQQGKWCYAFARVTYQAGASVCTNCRVSSALTVQNDTEMVLRQDTMTNEALWMMLDVANLLVLSNTSILSSWGNLDDYVSELLVRSYCGAWNGLHQWLSGGYLTSEISITVPAIQAQVDSNRVYAWFGAQILVALFGICFFSKLVRSKDPILGDITMLPFYLDTSDVVVHEAEGMLKAGRVGDRWKIEEMSPSLAGEYAPLVVNENR